MVLRAIKSSTLQDSAYKQLFRAIIEGKIAPGERITMDGLAKQLQVSIMPIREAIRRLEAGGFLTIKNRRIVVNELSEKNAHEILETRILLEGYVAEKASIRQSPKTLERLDELIQKMHQTKDLEIYLKANREFHTTIYREAGITVMLEIINSLWERYSPYFHMLNNIDWNSPELAETHNGMFEGMRQKDPKEVRRWLEKDLTIAADLIVAILKQEKKGNG
ncbi:MAG TPA: GntR family transcriptional regulator [Desulfatiglandales bacterium]|nr:GntR family transcriptional regulator [Desulfatiglandales bacterium]